ncbi:MAG: iron chelate uptake ABC transporter family permease subunit [Pseudomonadota bacterium]
MLIICGRNHKIIGIHSGGSLVWLPAYAVAGGFAAAAFVYLGGLRRTVSPARLALIGIAVGFLCVAGVDYILVTSPTYQFSTPLVWMTGSLWSRGWEDVAIAASRRRAVATSRRVALLPQTPGVPPAIRVDQRVSYGRAPCQNLMGMRRSGDAAAVRAALERAGIVEYRHRRLSDLSGRQRQRAFIAMCLARDTPVMLFDEPTSFLDIRYQYDTLDLLAEPAAGGRRSSSCCTTSGRPRVLPITWWL